MGHHEKVRSEVVEFLKQHTRAEAEKLGAISPLLLQL